MIVLPIDGKQVPVLSINGLRAHAVRTGDYAGGRVEYSSEVEDIDGLCLPRWCKYVVTRNMRNGSQAEFEGLVFASEAVGRKRDGSITKMWRSRGMHMLGIAAERLALRRAFPESIPPDDTAPAREMIDPNTGEIHGSAPSHLSDEDIAAGLDSVEAAEAGAVDGEWIDAYDNA